MEEQNQREPDPRPLDCWSYHVIPPFPNSKTNGTVIKKTLYLKETSPLHWLVALSA